MTEAVASVLPITSYGPGACALLRQNEYVIFFNQSFTICLTLFFYCFTSFASSSEFCFLFELPFYINLAAAIKILILSHINNLF